MGEPRYTEKEMVWLNRQAFEFGAEFNEALHRESGPCSAIIDRSVHQGEASRRYRLPKVERPRVVTDPLSPGVEWQVCDLLGCPTLRWKSLDTPEWRIYPAGNGGIHHMPSKERAALWWNLFSHPSEFVDDEG